LQGLLSEEKAGPGGVSDTQLIDHIWRPAEAYHFYILAQQQFKSNNAEGALRSALVLTEYDDILPVQTIYNLIGMLHRCTTFDTVCHLPTTIMINSFFMGFFVCLFVCYRLITNDLALCATSCGAFNTASKAFLKLEDDSSIDADDRKEYQKLAFQIFLR
jgi:hypothetical protein